MTIVENPDAVVGGVDTHVDMHMAAVVNHVGGILGVESFRTTQAGYRQLVSWLGSHGELVLVGVEGTGSYGVGLARYLARAGIAVVEVDRPNRQTRHRQGKSDPVDAVAAARAALSGQATGLPKARDGNVEAIRVFMIARRSAVDTRIETLNQLRHVVFTATPEIRAKFTGLTAISLGNKAAVNHALHLIAITQLRYPTTEGRSFYERKLAEGKTKKEAIRILKRRLSDVVYRHLQTDHQQ